jgi:hypothetical protein
MVLANESFCASVVLILLLLLLPLLRYDCGTFKAENNLSLRYFTSSMPPLKAAPGRDDDICTRCPPRIGI